MYQKMELIQINNSNLASLLNDNNLIKLLLNIYLLLIKILYLFVFK